MTCLPHPGDHPMVATMHCRTSQTILWWAGLDQSLMRKPLLGGPMPLLSLEEKQRRKAGLV